MDLNLQPSIQVSPPDHRPSEPNSASSFSQDTTSLSQSASFAMSPSSHTSPGAQAELMSPQTSSQLWGGHGNDLADTSFLGTEFQEPTGIGLDGELLRQSQLHGPDKLQQLCDDLEKISARTQRIVNHLDLHQLLRLQNRTRETLVYMVNAIQSRISCQVRHLRQTCKTRGSYTRHVTDMHVHRYHYDCLRRAEGCSWEHFRKDKVHDHTRAKHKELGDVTEAQIHSVETELPFPSKCKICDEFVGSWEEFLACMADHCELQNGNPTENNGGEYCNNNSAPRSVESINPQSILGVWPDAMDSYHLQDGYNSTVGGGAFDNHEPFASHQGISHPGGRSVDISHLGGQFSGSPGSIDVFKNVNHPSTGIMVPVEAMPLVKKGGALSDIGQSLPLEKSPSVPVVKITPNRRPHSSRSQAQNMAPVSDGSRINGSGQRPQSRLNPALPSHTQYQGFGGMIPNGSHPPLSPNRLVDQATNISSPGPSSPSGNVDVSRHSQLFGNVGKQSKLRSPVGAATADFQATALGKRPSALSTDDSQAFLPMSMRSVSGDAYNNASGPSLDALAQTPLETMSLPADSSSFMLDQPDDCSPGQFNDMNPFVQLALPTESTSRKPTSSSMLRSASQITYPVGRSFNLGLDGSGSHGL
ncbi:hypothetical protein PHISCL_04724 [Aspergillus sclerotialis]|uniref:C2H2-type domain-containing protein n=1 Tax=Aspergillus sclerotialis TaxID=2070753 RepID=A0A3A2ZYF3_9EURO|nr:hypothetical protein PHISCL_04724 [Aspergillus sclerotialis]